MNFQRRNSYSPDVPSLLFQVPLDNNPRSSVHRSSLSSVLTTTTEAAAAETVPPAPGPILSRTVARVLEETSAIRKSPSEMRTVQGLLVYTMKYVAPAPVSVLTRLLFSGTFVLSCSIVGGFFLLAFTLLYFVHARTLVCSGWTPSLFLSLVPKQVGQQLLLVRPSSL